MYSWATAVAAVVLSASLSPALGAQDVRSAADLYLAGDYDSAIARGEAEGGHGLAVAAQATLADASLRGAPCLECVKRGEMLARRAIAAEPADPHGYVMLVVALAYETRIIGTYGARRAHFPEQSRAAVDQALALAPDDPWVLAAAGGWNIEVVRSGGTILGRLMYGARFDTGVDYFRRAVAQDPENAALQLHFALALSSYAFSTARDEIGAALAAATRAMPADAYGKAMQARARTLLSLLQQDRRTEYLELARRYLGFPPGTAF